MATKIKANAALDATEQPQFAEEVAALSPSRGVDAGRGCALGDTGATMCCRQSLPMSAAGRRGLRPAGRSWRQGGQGGARQQQKIDARAAVGTGGPAGSKRGPQAQAS